MIKLDHLSGLSETVRGHIASYLKQEKQEEYLKGVEEAVARKDEELLKARFTKRIKFGTAGLRGVMGFGIDAMNGVTVLHASQGLCAYYLETLKEEAKGRWVCIGYDGRHNSEYFAHITAAVFLSQGFKVSLSQCVTATPMNPFAVVNLKAVCGIQVTASHNPKDDNGYKVYGSRGAQIIPPMDSDVMKLIEMYSGGAWEGVQDLMRHNLKRLNYAHPLMINLHDLQHQYVWPLYKQVVTAASFLKEGCLSDSKVSLIYTAMHGVGYPFVADMLTGYLKFPCDQFLVVPEQKMPDPEFATVHFPNPEEKGAMDKAIDLANRLGVTMIISNDPDADRFAACEKIDGAFRQFSGDELGAIFGSIMFEKFRDVGKLPPEKMAFFCSAVSSRYLYKLAKTEGAHFFETMTGFKWIMNKAFDVQASQGLTPVFCYEEALGYGCTMAVPDKDGVSAAALWVDKYSALHKEGKTMHDYLNQLSQKYGFFATQNSYYICKDPTLMKEIFQAFRKSGYPTAIGPYKVSNIRDLSQNYDSTTPDNKCTFPPTTDDMLTIYFENGAHITFRGSGTEPKFKYYSEMSHPESKVKAAAELKQVVQAVQAHLIGDRPLKHAV